MKLTDKQKQQLKELTGMYVSEEDSTYIIFGKSITERLYISKHRITYTKDYQEGLPTKWLLPIANILNSERAKKVIPAHYKKCEMCGNKNKYCIHCGGEKPVYVEEKVIYLTDNLDSINNTFKEELKENNEINKKTN